MSIVGKVGRFARRSGSFLVAGTVGVVVTLAPFLAGYQLPHATRHLFSSPGAEKQARDRRRRERKRHLREVGARAFLGDKY